MNSLLLLSLLACNKDGEPLDSGIAGELVTFTITVENVGVAYPYIDAALPGDDAVDVPVDSELTLIAVTDEGDGWLQGQLGGRRGEFPADRLLTAGQGAGGPRELQAAAARAGAGAGAGAGARA